MQSRNHTYTEKLTNPLQLDAMQDVIALGRTLQHAWQLDQSIYICGNGGNAIHLAHDFYTVLVKKRETCMRVVALSANSAVITCLANDISYDQIYAEQLKVKANAGDVLIVLSRSGNSPKLKMGNFLGTHIFAILAYSGWKF